MKRFLKFLYLAGVIVNAYAAVRLGKTNPIQGTLHYGIMLLLSVFFVIEFQDKKDE